MATDGDTADEEGEMKPNVEAVADERGEAVVGVEGVVVSMKFKCVLMRCALLSATPAIVGDFVVRMMVLLLLEPEGATGTAWPFSNVETEDDEGRGDDNGCVL